MTEIIYLDNQASTACDPRVLEAMWPWFAARPGNPGSVEHLIGQQAAEAVETARAEVAALIGASPAEIIFTSGATEANNLAIKGAARFAGPADRARIVTAATEHKCVLESGLTQSSCPSRHPVLSILQRWLAPCKRRPCWSASWAPTTKPALFMISNIWARSFVRPARGSTATSPRRQARSRST